MIKVGIIGLRSRQIDTVREHQYAAELLVFDRDRYNQETITGFANKCDRVVFLHGHTPASVYRHVPKDKIDIIPGNAGVSSVVKFLQDHYPVEKPAEKTVKFSPAPTPPKQEPASIAPAEQAQGTVQDLRGSWLGAVLVDSQVITYDPFAEFVTIGGDATGTKTRFQLIAAGRPGDVFRIPHDITKTTLVNIQGRHRYLAARYGELTGYELEAHIFKDYTDLFVSARRYHHRTMRAYIGSFDNWAERVTANIDPAHTRPVVEAVEQTAVLEESETIQETAAPAPAPVVNVAPATPLTLEEIDFWKQVMMALIADGEAVDSAAALASDATRELRKVYAQGL